MELPIAVCRFMNSNSSITSQNDTGKGFKIISFIEATKFVDCASGARDVLLYVYLCTSRRVFSSGMTNHLMLGCERTQVNNECLNVLPVVAPSIRHSESSYPLLSETVFNVIGRNSLQLTFTNHQCLCFG